MVDSVKVHGLYLLDGCVHCLVNGDNGKPLNCKVDGIVQVIEQISPNRLLVVMTRNNTVHKVKLSSLRMIACEIGQVS